MASQLRHLHRVKVLLLSHPDGDPGHPFVAAVGPPLRLPVVPLHLGCRALHAGLHDGVPVSESTLFADHTHLLGPVLRGAGEDLRWRESGSAQGGVSAVQREDQFMDVSLDC